MRRLLVCLTMAAAVSGCFDWPVSIRNDTGGQMHLVVYRTDGRLAYGRVSPGAYVQLRAPLADIRELRFTQGQEKCAISGAEVRRSAELKAYEGYVIPIRRCLPDANPALREFIELYSSQYEQAGSKYRSASIDLNRDGLKEEIVYLFGPHVCGSGGCPTLILTPDSGGYRIVSKISITFPPIRVLPSYTNGWRDISVHVSGGGIREGYDALLRFDGNGYPHNPTIVPAAPAGRQPGEITVIAPLPS